MTENQSPTPPAPPAPTAKRRQLWPLLTAGGLAVFLIGGATGAAIAPTPEPVTHTNIKEVEVEVPVTPAACAQVVDQIMELRLLATDMLAAAMSDDVVGLTAASDSMGTLNLKMAAAQGLCLQPAI